MSARRKDRSVSELIKNALAGVVCALIIFFVVLAVTPNSFSITSGSMEPTIPTGSWVLTVPQDVDENPYTPDEILSFRAIEQGDDEPRVVTHRMIGTEDDGSLITKGDANGARDFLAEPLHQEDVIGKVVFHVPYVGIPILLFKSVYALLGAGNIVMWAALIALAAAIAVYWIFFRGRDATEEESEENSKTSAPVA